MRLAIRRDRTTKRSSVCRRSKRWTTVVTNKRDPAVSNHVTARVASVWRERRPKAIAEYQFTDLPTNHDIIDPQNLVPRTDIVYPVLLQFVRSTMEVP